MCVCARACVCVYVCVYVIECVCACVRACVRAQSFGSKVSANLVTLVRNAQMYVVCFCPPSALRWTVRKVCGSERDPSRKEDLIGSYSHCFNSPPPLQMTRL